MNILIVSLMVNDFTHTLVGLKWHGSGRVPLCVHGAAKARCLLWCCALQCMMPSVEMIILYQESMYSSVMCPLSSICFHALVRHSLLAYPKSQVHVNCLLFVGPSTLCIFPSYNALVIVNIATTFWWIQTKW